MERLRKDGFPLSLRLIREMHATPLHGVRGQEKTAGQSRRSQNWISSPDNRVDTAAFVPPPVEEIASALDDWEKYLHDEAPRLPPLRRAQE